MDCMCVAPHVGAWIEITSSLKSMTGYGVAPHVGAWIEIGLRLDLDRVRDVAPHVGAWIEMRGSPTIPHRWASHPTWVRGLKLLKISVPTLV